MTLHMTQMMAAMARHPMLIGAGFLAFAFAAPGLQAQASGAQQAAGNRVIAITGGTVYPASGPKIENGTVIISDGRISAVGRNITIPSGATRVDASGKWVTPGLFDAMTTLGLNEGGSPQFSGGYNDAQATASDQMAATFDVVDGLNPANTFIRPTTEDGITTVAVFPTGNWIAGQGSVIDLDGSSVDDMLVRRGVGIQINLTAQASGTGARAAMWARLRALLDDAVQYRDRAAQSGGAAAVSATIAAGASSTSRLQLQALQGVVAGSMPLVAAVDRASDIRAILAIAKLYNLKLIIASGAEAWEVADELAAARVPVMVGALNNIPETFDKLGQRQENAGLLRAAGVDVSIIGNGPGGPTAFNVRNLRQEAGNAVAYGMAWDDALKAVTLAPALALGVETQVGSLTPGTQGNVVVWDGDPFEFSTRATHVYIRGMLQTSASRQDELVARYKTLPAQFSQPNTGSSPAGSPSRSGAGASGPADDRALRGDWTLVTLTGTASIEGLDGKQPTLSFGDGRASGFAGCNRFNGGYTLAPGELSAASVAGLHFGALASTMMACVGAGDAVERAYHAMLVRVTRVAVNAGSLTLRDDRGVLAVYRKN